jgi:hypothetical protein
MSGDDPSPAGNRSVTENRHLQMPASNNLYDVWMLTQFGNGLAFTNEPLGEMRLRTVRAMPKDNTETAAAESHSSAARATGRTAAF